MAKRKATPRRRPTAAPKRAAAPRRRATAAKATARKSARRLAKPARPAAKKTKSAVKRSVKRAPVKAAKKAPQKLTKKTLARKAAQKPARKAAPLKAVRRGAVAKKAAPRKPALLPKVVARQKTVAPPKPTLVPPPRAAAAAPKPNPKPNPRPTAPSRAASGVSGKKKHALGLDRERRVIQDEDDLVLSTPPSSLNLDRSASSARTGRQELKERYENHNETSPALTAGDVDADWESAYSVGDEAPGGDNPTPDQNVVDDIGIAVGNEYRDNEELEGADKIEERDKHRWELDPKSSDDFDER
jgi:hypothetical protein